MSKYIILLNGGCFYNKDYKNMFSMKELEVEINKWSNGEDLLNEENEVLEIEDLIDCEGIKLFVDSMVEMGDDYIEINIIKLV